MKGTIELTGMEFFARHGCLEEERVEGNLFRVDFRACTELGRAVESDALSDTLDYAAVYDLIAEQMAIPSNLLEHVAGRILQAVREAFPAIEEAEVRVAKKNPPVAGPVEWSAVTLTYRRDEP